MSWIDRTQEIKVGDRVAYRRQFLRDIGCYTGDLPQARGEVTALVRIGDIVVAEVDWDLPDVPERVNVRNLCSVARIAFESP